MNRKPQSVVLAGLLALALTGCSSTRGGSGSDDDLGGSGGMGGGTDGAAAIGVDSAAGGMAGTSSGSVAAPPQSTGAAGSTMMPGGMPNAVVISIEVVPRQAGTAAAGAVGTSGTTGTTGSSAGVDSVYRITLRMDDGTTRVVTQDRAPSFRGGDRVNMMDGSITR